MTEKQLCFEKAFTRLESILERMNSGEITLEESLDLFEEADSLILHCNKQLGNAEKRVEKLIKNRNSELSLGADQRPLTTDFTVEN